MNPASASEPFQLQLHLFEGPLDLLLHLIERDELNIYDIPIAHVTDQYMALLRNSLALQMEVASEFIVMAATLIAIKARSLLPKTEPTDDSDLQSDFDDEYTDPEWELTQRLLEYRAYKEVSLRFQEMEHARSQVVGRIPLALDEYRTEPVSVDILQGITLELLGEAISRAMLRARPIREVNVLRDRETIAQRMRLIEKQLEHGSIRFVSLLRHQGRREVVTVFLALLELIRQNKIICLQKGLFADLWIERRSTTMP